MHIKKAAVSVILTAVFCLLVFVLTRPLLAELRLTAAEDLVKHYKWAQAEKEFRAAITIDPFNSRYYRELGDFLFAQSGYQAHKEPMMREAEKLFTRAVELDPRNAEGWLKLGLIELNRTAYTKAFEDFHRATENDPNGFNVSYAIGSAGLSVWNYISQADRAFVIERLKSAMMARPSGDIYLKVWSTRKDIKLLRAITADSLEAQQGLYYFITSHNLWQFRREQAKILERYAKSKAVHTPALRKTGEAKSKISAADWRGSTPDGKFKYENGNMYWSGTVSALIDCPEGAVTVRISARGQPADKIYPYMIVELDGEEIGETLVDNADWKEYEFKINVGGGVKVLSVTFVNDECNATEDRNLFVGAVRCD